MFQLVLYNIKIFLYLRPFLYWRQITYYSGLAPFPVFRYPRIQKVPSNSLSLKTSSTVNSTQYSLQIFQWFLSSPVPFLCRWSRYLYEPFKTSLTSHGTYPIRDLSSVLFTQGICIIIPSLLVRFLRPLIDKVLTYCLEKDPNYTSYLIFLHSLYYPIFYYISYTLLSYILW